MLVTTTSIQQATKLVEICTSSGEASWCAAVSAGGRFYACDADGMAELTAGRDLDPQIVFEREETHLEGAHGRHRLITESFLAYFLQSVRSLGSVVRYGAEVPTTFGISRIDEWTVTEQRMSRYYWLEERGRPQPQPLGYIVDDNAPMWTAERVDERGYTRRATSGSSARAAVANGRERDAQRTLANQPIG